MAQRTLPGPVLALLRFASGSLLALFHGWGKMNAAYAHFIDGDDWRFIQVVGDIGFPVPAFFAVAATMAVFLGGILLALGLFTRQAALAIAVTMAVAVVHHLTTDMRFELAALYLALSLVFFLGPTTPFSVDEKIASRHEQS
ncbi:MAG: DoxX family protein [Proteobacteria bacterium]|nr:DoxX family protein [Pseudomonadota bacterium]